MIDEALARLGSVCKVVVPALLPLVHRGPGRPPIRDADVLLDDRRRQIFAFVRKTPGLPPTEIIDALGLGGGTFYHHLDKLEAAGLLERKTVAGRVRVYPAGEAPTPTEEPLESEAIRRSAEILVERGSVSSTELAAYFGVSRRMALNYLRQLVQHGWARAEGRGRLQRYIPSQGLIKKFRGRA